MIIKNLRTAFFVWLAILFGSAWGSIYYAWLTLLMIFSFFVVGFIVGASAEKKGTV